MNLRVSRRAKPLAWAALATLQLCAPARAEDASSDFGIAAALSSIPSLLGEVFGDTPAPRKDDAATPAAATTPPAQAGITGAIGIADPSADLPNKTEPVGAAVTSRAVTAAIAKIPAPTGVTKTQAVPAEDALGGDQTKTRFVIGLDRTAKFQISSLANPNRVIVDVTSLKLRLPVMTEGKAIGLIESFQAGIAGNEHSRVVINVTEPVIVESARIESGQDGKGQRLAIEIVPADAPQKAEARKPFKTAPFGLGAFSLQPPMPQPAMRPEVRAAKAFKPIIVIDPGHGGHDSGAQKDGTVEKDVVLAFSKVLRDQINATGRYRAVMTRDTDIFIELGERVNIAERNKANLFIAVHADYATTRARGATIYSLRDKVATELRRSAKGDISERILSREEISAVEEASGDVGVVKNILADLALREVDATQERTTVFARTVVEKMGTSTGMRDDPEKSASFKVLKTQQFPSVLIELAYVSNKEDAELLQSDTWRNKVAGSIVNAVENYFSHQVARLPL